MGYSLDQIREAFIAHGMNQRATARALSMNRATLQNKLAMIDISASPSVSSEMILRDRISRLESELHAFQRDSLDANYVRAKILNIKDAVEGMAPPKWMSPPTVRSKRSQSVPTLFLSDLHWGEYIDKDQTGGINEYDITIANRRLETVVNRAIHILRGSITGEDYPGIILPLGGDMLAGDIHEELRESNDGTTLAALLDLLRALISQVDLLAREFGKVYIPCVVGNHGRTTHRPRAKRRNETNLDWLLYQFLAMHFQGDSRVTVDAPTTPEVTYRVFNHTYHLCHGDQLGKGGDGIIGAFGPIIRGDHKRRALQSQLNRPYDTLLHGHYHTYAATRRFISNGSLPGYDEYAMACGLGFDIPQQAFWLTHPEHGITFSMPVHAERPSKQKGREWVSFEGSICQM